MYRQQSWAEKIENIDQFHLKELENFGPAWMETMTPYLKNAPGRKAVDIGCGTAFLTILLAQNGWEVTAVDNSPAVLKKAGENAAYYGLADRITFLECDAADLKIESGSMDALVSRHATFLFREPEACYAEGFRVLRSGGILMNLDANWMAPLWDSAAAQQFQSDERELVEQFGPYRDIYHHKELVEQLRWLPLAQKLRPRWDKGICRQAGFTKVESRFVLKQRLWNEVMALRYRAIPTFAVTAVKE